MPKARMSKVHYKLLANAIRNCKEQTYDGIIEALSQALIVTNNKFDQEAFENLCYGLEKRTEEA
jgi:hypothetical protein